MFTNNYRVTRDDYNGYVVEKKRWWFPLYLRLGMNTCTSLTNAKKLISRDLWGAKEVVYIKQEDLVYLGEEVKVR